MDKICVLLPAYNESRRLPEVLRGIRRLKIDRAAVEVVVIDDASTDDTAARARSEGARVVSLEANSGVGAALGRGLELARAENFDFLVHMDSDGQLDPAQIPAVLDPVRRGEADAVIGSRFLNGHPQYLARWKALALRAAAGFVGAVVGARLTDLSCGIRCLNRRALEVARPGFRYDYIQQTLLQFFAANLRVAEAPVKAVAGERGKGISGRTAKYSVRFAALLAYSLWSYAGSRLKHHLRASLTEEAWDRIRWVFLAAAVVYSCVQRVVYALPNQDTHRLLDFGLSLMEGHGLTSAAPAFTNMSYISRSPLIEWPPLVSAAVALLAPVMGGEWALAVVDTLPAPIFFISWFVITEKLRPEIPVAARMLVWAAWAFGPDPLFVLRPSLGLAVAWFSCALALSVAGLSVGGRAAAGLASGAAMALACMSHFAAWPLIAVMPLAAAGWARIPAMKGAWNMVRLQFLTGALSLCAFAAWMWARAGAVTYLSKTPKRALGELAWGSLLTVYPFFSSALGLERVWVFFREGFMQYWDHNPPSLFDRALWLPAIFLMAAYAWQLKETLGRKDASTAPARAARFVALAGAWTMPLTLAMLALLSLKLHTGAESYLEVPRYYAVSYPFILIGLASFLMSARPDRPRRILSGVLILCIFAASAVVGLRARYISWGAKIQNREFVPPAVLGERIAREARGLPVVFIHNASTHGMLRAATLLRLPTMFLYSRPEKLGTRRPVFVVTGQNAASPEAPRPLGGLFQGRKPAVLIERGRNRLVGFELPPGEYPLDWKGIRFR